MCINLQVVCAWIDLCCITSIKAINIHLYQSVYINVFVLYTCMKVKVTIHQNLYVLQIWKHTIPYFLHIHTNVSPKLFAISLGYLMLNKIPHSSEHHWCRTLERLHYSKIMCTSNKFRYVIQCIFSLRFTKFLLELLFFKVETT